MRYAPTVKNTHFLIGNLDEDLLGIYWIGLSASAVLRG